MSDTITDSATNTRGNRPHPPSIADLDAAWNETDAAWDRAEAAVSAASQAKNGLAGLAANDALTLADDRGVAIRDLIATMTAVTVSDAIAQLRVALDLANALSFSEYDPERSPAKMKALHRMLRSAVPVLLKSALLEMPASKGGDRRHDDAIEPSHPDAAMIAACKAFDLLELEHRRLLPIADVVTPEEAANAEVIDAEVAMKRIEAEQEMHVAAIVSAQATTNEGQAARARSLVGWDRPVLDTMASGDTGKRLTAAILRDLIAATPSATA